MDIIDLVPWLVGLSFTTIIVLVLYFYYLKPREEEPLPHERKLGFWTIWLKEHGVHTGYASTASSTVHKLLSEVIQNETEKTDVKNLQVFKKALEKFSLIAQKFEGKTYILVFNKNPEDQKFLAVDPNRANAYMLNGVQDVVGEVEWKGMSFFGVKLTSEMIDFKTDEKGFMDTVLQALKYLRDAARNTEKIHMLKEELKSESEAKVEVQKKGAELRSQLDAALYALEQKPLSTEKVELPSRIPKTVKKWFGDPIQWILAIFGLVFLGPYLLQTLGWNWLPPLTTYFAIFVAFICFFMPPVLKKLFGRWI